MRIRTHATAIFAVIVTTGLLAGCVSDPDNPALDDAVAPLQVGAAQAAREREEEAAEERKRRAFRRRLQEQQEGEGGGEGGGGSTGH